MLPRLLRFSLPAVLCKEHQSQGKEAAAAEAEMNTKGMAIALALIICATAVQGFVMFKGGRCLCIGPGAKAVRKADIERVSVIHPSNGCDKVEVIVTLKAQKGQRCLDPRSKQARLIRQKIEKNNSLKHRNM
ncbi:C-X-C motif chemokine 11 [Meriones unguiculatus]|uniref:C-X-C motif chemokine 11 n=1 Tax=Meriones unguiculatus TaxID=10047 RepID=UPI00108A1966|nr:C-X-C motif chemokine 11 [Meriones unguiculatus]